MATYRYLSDPWNTPLCEEATLRPKRYLQDRRFRPVSDMSRSGRSGRGCPRQPSRELALCSAPTSVTRVSQEESVSAPGMPAALSAGPMYEWRVIRPKLGLLA